MEKGLREARGLQVLEQQELPELLVEKAQLGLPELLVLTEPQVLQE